MGLVFRKSMKKNRGGICRNISFGKILIFSLIISVVISIYLVILNLHIVIHTKVLIVDLGLVLFLFLIWCRNRIL